MRGLGTFKCGHDEAKDLVSIKPEHVSLAFHAAQDGNGITLAEVRRGTPGFCTTDLCAEAGPPGQRSHHVWAGGCFIPRTRAAASRAVLGIRTQLFAYVAEASHFSGRNNALSYTRSYEKCHQFPRNAGIGHCVRTWQEGGRVLPQHICHVCVDGTRWEWAPSPTAKVSDMPRP